MNTFDSEIVGVIPSAGNATRIGGFLKELTPINVNKTDPRKFVVVLEQIINGICSVAKTDIQINIITRFSKGIIAEYLTEEVTLSKNAVLSYRYQKNVSTYYGMPFALKDVHTYMKGKTVILGMPDTIIEPSNAFKILYDNFQKHGSDIELGLFPTVPNTGHDGGYIVINPNSKKVITHVDKSNKSRFSKEEADNSWAIACWNPKFTEFMLKFIENHQAEYKNKKEDPNFKEMVFGDILDAAIREESINICADYIPNGFYLDISTPERYFEAINHYHASKENLKTHDTSTNKPKVFISHCENTPALERLCQFVENAGLVPLVVINEPNLSMTINQKVTNYLDQADLVVFLATGDDTDSKGNRIPAGNILHEIGLAQGNSDLKNKMIYLLEEGAAFPTNIKPNAYIRFDKNNIDNCFTEIIKEIRGMGY